jgi:sugar-specific transcriptional regulator TrmB
MDTAQQLETYLKKLDIDKNATKVYLQLISVGPSSALQLAKATAISRTQMYRHLEALQAKGLVSSEQLSYGTLFRALPLQNLEATIADREATTTALKQDLSSMSHLLQQFAGSSGPTATTQHYYGLAGLKQANWNLTKANGEFRVFEAAHLSDHLDDKAFTRRFRERCIERQLISYDLTNDTTVQAADIEPFTPGRVHFHHISPEILIINFEMYIYNNTVTLLDYREGHEHALEIEHPQLHQMMQQLFNAMWKMGQPLTIPS